MAVPVHTYMQHHFRLCCVGALVYMPARIAAELVTACDYVHDAWHAFRVQRWHTCDLNEWPHPTNSAHMILVVDIYFHICRGVMSVLLLVSSPFCPALQAVNV